jgi:hypothetical protein
MVREPECTTLLVCLLTDVLVVLTLRFPGATFRGLLGDTTGLGETLGALMGLLGMGVSGVAGNTSNCSCTSSPLPLKPQRWS